MNKELKDIIKDTTSVNIHYYRKGVIERCVKRRMTACRVDSEEEYAEVLKSDEEEKEHLLEKLTINITDFFRAKSFFETLKKILSERYYTRQKIKVWSAACSKGQEPYSLGIILEELGLDYSILGTDISNEALKHAKRGFYGKNQLKNISEKRKEKFFRKEDDGYQVIDRVRKKISFERHDIISDSVPGKFDLITCRNVLKFFNKAIQKTVFINLHKSLKEHGILGIGMVESFPKEHVGKLFKPINSGKKIYEKI